MALAKFKFLKLLFEGIRHFFSFLFVYYHIDPQSKLLKMAFSRKNLKNLTGTLPYHQLLCVKLSKM